MIAAFLAAALSVAAATASGAWLDAKPIVPWNTAPRLEPPVRPGAPDRELNPGGRCASTVRPPTSTEDHALVTRGWSLVGPYQRYGVTSVVSAMAGADGMCRPLRYQSFVFVDGWYAGTLAPALMDARTDASIGAMSIPLYNTTEFTVNFERYTPDDPLCCPSATTSVMYRVKSLAGRPHIVPVSAATQKNLR